MNRNRQQDTTVTPFGVVRIPGGGRPLDELDPETLATLGRMLADQDAHPERYGVDADLASAAAEEGLGRAVQAGKERVCAERGLPDPEPDVETGFGRLPAAGVTFDDATDAQRDTLERWLEHAARADAQDSAEREARWALARASEAGKTRRH